jgi:hypothetical protein
MGIGFKDQTRVEGQSLKALGLILKLHTPRLEGCHESRVLAGRDAELLNPIIPGSKVNPGFAARRWMKE